jgi:hypothetical protein
MEWAALIAWVLTAGGGFLMLAIWLARGGMRQREPGRIRSPLILGHFALAATGLVLWIIYLVTDSDALAFTMFAIWQRQRQERAKAGHAPAEGGAPQEPAEQRFPVPIVALHGLGAATTLVLVLLAALGVGTG